MFVRVGAHRFDLGNEHVLDEKVGRIITQKRAVFVEDLQWPPLLDFQPHFSEAMGEAGLIDLFEHAAAQVAVQLESRLSDHVAQHHDIRHDTPPEIAAKNAKDAKGHFSENIAGTPQVQTDSATTVLA